jgi:hypothetical protein
MSRVLAVAAAAVLALLAPLAASYAARDLASLATPPPPSDLQLVVIEVPGCIYCRIFRRDVLPGYEASPRAREVPLRFVDLNEPGADGLELSAPITIVPTVLLVEGTREVGRITGYTGPENFFHSVNYMLSTTRPLATPED